jgi:hypothetical protein
MKKTIIILKVILLISFLLITPLNEHGVPLFAVLLMWFYQVSDLFTIPLGKVSWDVLTVIPIVGALIVAMSCKLYKQKYLLLFCMFTLFIFLVYALGSSFDIEYFHLGYLWFIVPLTIFVISSILLLYFNFKKPKMEIA